ADVSITGTVISATEVVCVDNGTDYVAFDKEVIDLSLNVGDEVTVIGSKMNDAFTARSVSKPAQDLMSRKCAAIKQRCATFSPTPTPA
ncbi:MAG: hypothetical protein ACXVIP_05900, partial [Halobacteriota archaeon]